MTILNHQLKSILQKGSFSGFDAAKIAFFDAWEGEQARDQLLTGRERREMLNGLKKSDDIDEYDNWILALPTIINITKDALICGQEAIINLLRLGCGLYRRYLLDAPGGGIVKEGLAGISFLSPPSKDVWDYLGTTPRDYVENTVSAVTGGLEYFFFCKTILTLLSEKTKVLFCEDVERVERSIDFTIAWTIDVYAMARQFSRRVKGALEGMPENMEITYSGVSREVEMAFRKRLAEPLNGDRWFFDCTVMWLRERFKKMPLEEVEREWLSNPKLGNNVRNKMRKLFAGAAEI